jgi:thioredoxin-related protein
VILRRTGVVLALGAVAATLSPLRMAHAVPHTLPTAKALDEDLAYALQQGKPLIVMVSLPGCPFCKMVRESYLPSTVQEHGLTVLQVDMHQPTPVADLHGRSTTHGQLVRDWGIKVAPTLLFFGKQGLEVAPRLIGAAVPDFYGAYLQERIDKALKATTQGRT